MFVAEPTPSSLSQALEGVDGDVEFLSEGEPFNYIHKVIATEAGETDVYLIGNIDDGERSQEISLRGRYHSVNALDPCTGECSRLPVRRTGGRTCFELNLAPSAAVIIEAR